jgi:hypothetical protein
MLIVFLFLSIVNAAVVSKNGTVSSTSSESTSLHPEISTTLSPSITFGSPCVVEGLYSIPTVITVSRSSATVYQLGGVEVSNPYSFPDVEPNTSLRSSCSSIFDKSLTEWLGTASITLGVAATISKTSYTQTTVSLEKTHYEGCQDSTYVRILRAENFYFISSLTFIFAHL